MSEKPSFIHKTSLGQNFLVDRNILGKIINYADITTQDVVLEVGSGMGILTAELASSGCRKVYSIEIDRRLDPFLAPLQHKYSNLSIIWEDAVKYPFETMDPFPTKMVANIPYNITTPLLWNILIASQSKGLSYFLLMLQKEAAERICASPCTKERYPLGITIEAIGRAKTLLGVSRMAFRPIPKVKSVLLEIKIENKFHDIYTLSWRKMLKAAFSQRRKKLVNNLVPLLGDMDKNILGQLLKDLGIDAASRAEQLTTPQWIKLHMAIRGKINGKN